SAPRSPKRWRRADGSRNRFFSIRFLCFYTLFVSKRDVLHLVGFESRWGVGCYMKETPVAGSCAKQERAIRQWLTTSFALSPGFGEEGMEVRRLNRPDIAALSTHNRAAHLFDEGVRLFLG